MFRKLIPSFILDQVAAGAAAGELDTVCLFVDVSGFTPLTTRLMQHGAEGAEVIASVLAALFEPLIEAIHDEGGFVAGFAGDAFKAIFPASLPLAYRRAFQAAWRIRHHLAMHATHMTRFGPFDFSGKVCMADGAVEWTVWRDDRARSVPFGQQAASFFGGEGLRQCMAIDAFARAGDIVMTTRVHDQIRDAGAQTEAVDRYWRVVDWLVTTQPAGAANGTPGTTALVPPEHEAYATQFFPASVLTSPIAGEFRRVVTLFVNCQAQPDAMQQARFAETLFELLNRHGGYLCRAGNIGGKDSGSTLLIFFGAPTGYEHDVPRALHFLLDLQAAAPMPLRAGITTNLAFAGYVGSARFQEYTCHGPHVNLAARLMVASGWHELWLDGATERRAANVFDMTPLGDMAFKGFDTRQPVFRLMGRRAQAAETFYQGALIGRQHELHILEEAALPIRRGRFGGVVLVVGEPGLGKSRLVYEFEQQTRSSSFAVPATAVWFRCQPDEVVRASLNPFRYFLRTYFRQSAMVDAPANRQALDVVLDQLIAVTVDATLRADLERGRAFLAALVDLAPTDAHFEQIEPKLRFDNTLDALKALIKAESLRQPVIVHLEDAHWLDDDSRIFLERLTHNVEGFPFLLVVTTRPEGEFAPDAGSPSWLAADLPQQTIRLTALGQEEVAALVSARLGGSPAPDLLTLVTTQAEGVPFFAEQVVLYLQEQDLIEESDGVWALRPDTRSTDAAHALSGDVRSVLTARLDRLPLPVKIAVQTASVLGREFDTRVLAAMLDGDSALPDKLAVADRASIWAAVADVRYLFRHALLRDAAYDMQLRAHLRSLHRRAVTAVEQVYASEPAPQYAALVYHSRQGEDTAVERHYARLAGDYAAGLFANQDALRYFGRALELASPEQVELRYDLLAAREQVSDVLGDRKAQAEDLAAQVAIVNQLGDARRESRLYLRQARYWQLMRDYTAADSAAQEAIRLAQAAGDLEAVVVGLHRLGDSLLQQGDYGKATEHLTKAWEMAAMLGAVKEQAGIRFSLGHIPMFQSRFEEARQHIDGARRAYAQLADRQGEVGCLFIFGQIAWRQGQFGEAQAYFTNALAICQMIGWRHFDAYVRGALGDNYFDLGDYPSARASHDAALATFRELHDREGEALSLDVLALIACVERNFGTTLTLSHIALAIQREIGDRRGEGYTLTYLGHALLGLGDVDQAVQAFQQAIDVRRQMGNESSTVDSLAGLAFAHWRQDDLATAASEAASILRWIEGNGVDGIELPVQVFYICYEILSAQSATDLAKTALTQGYAVVKERAERIQDPVLRQGFLTNGYLNHEIIQRWEALNTELTAT